MKRQSNIYNLSRKEIIGIASDALAAELQAYENLSSELDDATGCKKNLTAVLKYFQNVASIFDIIAIPHPKLDKSIKCLSTSRDLLYVGTSNHFNTQLSEEAINDLQDNIERAVATGGEEIGRNISTLKRMKHGLSRITPRTILMDLSYAVKSCWNWGVHVIANAKHKLKLWFYGGENNTTAFASNNGTSKVIATAATTNPEDPYQLKLNELRAGYQAAQKFHTGFNGAEKFYGDACPDFKRFKATEIRKNNQTMRDLAEEISVTKYRIDVKNKPVAL